MADIPAPEVSSDGVVVWVNWIHGAIARFGRKGIDVHSSDTTKCLYCTQGDTTAADWETFKQAVWVAHAVEVTDEHKPVRFKEHCA